MMKKNKFLELIMAEGLYDKKDAIKAYNAVMSSIEKGILSSDGIKIPNVGILKKVVRKARKIKVPTVKDFVDVKKRETLIIDIDDTLKFKLNKNRK